MGGKPFRKHGPPIKNQRQTQNKLAKAQKTRKSPGTLGLKKFGPCKLWVKKVWDQNMVKY